MYIIVQTLFYFRELEQLVDEADSTKDGFVNYEGKVIIDIVFFLERKGEF